MHLNKCLISVLPCLIFKSITAALTALPDASNHVAIKPNTIVFDENHLIEEIMGDVFAGLASKDLFIHFDEYSSHFIDKIFRKKDYKNDPIFEKKYVSKEITIITLMFYNDNKYFKIDGNSQRRSTIHVVMLQNTSMFDDLFINHLKPTDGILFVCVKYYTSCNEAFGTDANSTLNTHFLKSSNIFTAVLDVLVIEFSENSLRLYKVCFYCSENIKTLTLQYEIDLNSGSLFDSDIGSRIKNSLDEKSWDLKTHSFDITFHHNGINFACVKPFNISLSSGAIKVICENSVSLEGNMLEEIQKRLKFNYTLVNFEYKYGSVRETLLNIVNEEKADWAIGSITITASRWKKSDFSYFVLEDPCKVLYNVQETVFIKEGLKIIYVFTTITWTAIATTLLLQSLAVYVCSKITKTEKSLPFSEIIWIVGFLLTEQSHHGQLKAIRGRVLVFWLLCTINVSTLYKAQLSSFITRPPHDKLSTFDQLVKDGYNLNVINARFILPMLNSSSDKSFQELSHRVTLSNEICKTLHQFIGKREIIIEEIDILYDALIRDCKGIYSTNELLSLRVTHDNIFPSSHGWVFRKGTPYLYYINKYILWFHESGLQKKWSEDLINEPKKLGVRLDGKKKKVDDFDSSSRTKQLFGLFVLWFIGIGLSGMCFVGEIVLKFVFHHQKATQFLE